MSLLLEPPFPEAILVIIGASLAMIVWTLARYACCGDADKDVDDWQCASCACSCGRQLARDAYCPNGAHGSGPLRPEANASDFRRRSSGRSSSADASAPRRRSHGTRASSGLEADTSAPSLHRRTSGTSSSARSEADTTTPRQPSSGASSPTVRHGFAAYDHSLSSFGFQSEGNLRHERSMDQIELSRFSRSPLSRSESRPAFQRPGQPVYVVIAPESSSSNLDPRADDFGSSPQRTERALSLPGVPTTSPRPRNTSGSAPGTPSVQSVHRDSPRQLPPVTESRQERIREVDHAARRYSSFQDLRMSELGLPGRPPASSSLARRPSEPSLGQAQGSRLTRRPSVPNLRAGTSRRKSVPQKMHLSSGSLFYTNVIHKQVMRDVQERRSVNEEAGVDVH